MALAAADMAGFGASKRGPDQGSRVLLRGRVVEDGSREGVGWNQKYSCDALESRVFCVVSIVLLGNDGCQLWTMDSALGGSCHVHGRRVSGIVGRGKLQQAYTGEQAHVRAKSQSPGRHDRKRQAGPRLISAAHQSIRQLFGFAPTLFLQLVLRKASRSCPELFGSEGRWKELRWFVCIKENRRTGGTMQAQQTRGNTETFREQASHSSTPHLAKTIGFALRLR